MSRKFVEAQWSPPAMTLGKTPGGDEIAWDPVANSPLLVTGPQGSGKTNLGRTLLCNALTSGWHTYIIDVDGRHASSALSPDTEYGSYPEEWLVVCLRDKDAELAASACVSLTEDRLAALAGRGQELSVMAIEPAHNPDGFPFRRYLFLVEDPSGGRWPVRNTERQFWRSLCRIAGLGREAGIYVVLLAREEDAYPVAVRHHVRTILELQGRRPGLGVWSASGNVETEIQTTKTGRSRLELLSRASWPEP